ncbi:carbohydrate ABC transporter permease [Paracoccus seriniphilus]|uniref:carbohydrate ABC transporter permease n=1 Tax=Paracoccus seriniphilus TaxID=184748 RepID=UPI0035687DA5
MIENLSDRRWRRLGITPLLLLYGLIAILPVLNLFWSSFFSIDWVAGAEQREFVGLGNYAKIPSDSFYGVGAANTVFFAVSTVVIQMVLGFALALVVSRSKIRSNAYRTIFILPILIPGIVVGAIWRLMFDVDFGVINQVIGLVGIEPLAWTARAGLAMLSIIVVDIWHWTPFVFLLLFAGLQGLPEDVFEAARVDGTPFWRELWCITLPLMLPTLVVTLLFRIILAFKVFDEIYLLTSGGPGTATEVISFSIFRTFFIADDVGYGSAISFTTMFVIALLIVIALGVQARARASQ